MKLKSIELEFTPDYSPFQMFSKGVFGGTYFRPIYSKVSNSTHFEDYLQFPDLASLPLHLLAQSVYNPKTNYYKVKTGTTLSFWQFKKWIRPPDFRGWAQWYCRYYYGRRSKDDIRQIKRWKGMKSRFGKRKNPSLKIKQVLLEWAIKY